MRATRAILLIACAVLLPGCTDRDSVAGQHTGPSAGRLVDFEGCQLAYPSGAAVDCSVSLAQSPSASVRSGMECLERLDSADARLTVWGNNQGQVDLEYEIFRSLEGADAVGWARGTLGGQNVEIHFVGKSHGVLALPFERSTERYFNGSFALRELTSSGEPAFLDAKPRFLISEFGEDPWYVWSYSSESQDYRFQSMTKVYADGRDNWIPVSAEFKGEDLKLDLTVRLHMIAGLANNLPGQNPLVKDWNSC